MTNLKSCGAVWIREQEEESGLGRGEEAKSEEEKIAAMFGEEGTLCVSIELKR